MSLASGTRLGPYEITSKLGEGGMGEVYRATDSRLGREVAIKVLPESVAQDPERLARFEREAKILASLNHNNIATIHGIEEGGSALALVMELVEGPTLADRLAQGPMPLDEALPVARQIAEGLEYAHERGIIHRDLKPANIKLTSEDHVKILDFGLAKALEPDAASGGIADLSHSPTLTYQATVQGLILGTASYMSPEQAAGKPVDKRSDIWSFGVVLWEMLTGGKLFGGETVAEIMADVLRGEIDLGALPAGTPASILQLLRRCLERNPKNRLHDIADARLVMDDVLSGADLTEGLAIGEASDVTRTGSRRRWITMIGIVVAVALAGLLAGRLIWSGDSTRTSPKHLAIRLAPNQELGSGGNTPLVFSPDGSTLVFAGREDGRIRLLRRRLSGSQAVPIAGTDNPTAPFFSPDGRWIGFAASDHLRKVPVDGGNPIPLGEWRGAGGACWLTDGTIVFAPIYSDGLFRVSADGGKPERLTTPDHAGGVLGHWWPRPLPGERRILFTAFRTPMNDSRIGVLDLNTHKVRWLVDGGFDARYVAGGYLLYARAKRIYAMPFDPEKAIATGPAVPVIDDVQTSQSTAFAEYAVAPDGTLAYATETLSNPLSRLVWIDRQGRISDALDESRRFESVGVSPDGSRAATTILGESRDLWTVSFDRGVLSRLTTGADTEFGPVWTPDGKELIYVVDAPPFTLNQIALGAPDSGRPLWDGKVQQDTFEPQLSPDGRTVVFARSEKGTGNNLYLRTLDGSAPARALRATRATEDFPSFSPDGRWVAYESDESGRYEIYADPVDGSGQHIQVSADGGREPVWAANGEIFFLHDDELRVVAARLGGRLDLQPTRTLFRVPIAFKPDEQLRTYDVAPDGSRVLAIYTPEESRPRQIEVITDWAAQLPRLISGGGK
jgi:serine/threonine protein kinase/Tol biopolymer transport system component